MTCHVGSLQNEDFCFLTKKEELRALDVMMNKAGYTAGQLGGRLGRGRGAKTARIPKMLQTDGPMDGRTDTARCRIACPRLRTMHIGDR